MIIFLFFSLASALDTASKEDSCFYLASYLVRERQEEISTHLKAYPHLKEPEVRLKVIELGFYECMEKISEEQVKEVKNNNKREFSKFRSLVQVGIGKLVSLREVKLTEDFVRKRQEIGKRISFTKKSGSDL